MIHVSYAVTLALVLAGLLLAWISYWDEKSKGGDK